MRSSRVSGRAAAVLVIAVVVLSSCTSSTEPVAGPHPVPDLVGDTEPAPATGLAWSRCRAEDDDPELRRASVERLAAHQCTTFDGPVDYAQPDGLTLELYASRRPATAPDSLGPLFVNHPTTGNPLRRCALLLDRCARQRRDDRLNPALACAAQFCSTTSCAKVLPCGQSPSSK